MFLVSKCPYCQTKIPFDVKGVYLQKALMRNSDDLIYFDILSICRECKTSTIFSIYRNITNAIIHSNIAETWFGKDDIIREKEKWTSYLNQEKDNNLLDNFKIEKIVRPPTYTSYQCPEYVPDTIKNIFEEAAQCYAHDLLRASLSMLRTCLDLATKELLTEDKDKTLFKRIEILCKQGLIRPRLEKMASEIRIDGNITAHDGYVNQESLKSIFHFTIFLLRELFTDPTEMETNEERRAQLKQGKVK